MTWVPTRPNLLPVDPAAGGLARFIGWLDDTSTVKATPGNGTLTLPRDGWVTTVPVAGGVAVAKIVAAAGRAYTAAVTADSFAAVSVLWVLDDGTVLYDSTGLGSGRVAVTATAPPNVSGVVVELSAPTMRLTEDDGTTYQITLSDRMVTGPWTFAADPTTAAGPVTFSDPVLVGFPTDPGPLNPTVLDNTLGARLYQSLPQFMRTDDQHQLLRNFTAGVGVIDDKLQDIAGQIRVGALTDPYNAPDVWIPWLATMAGVPVTDVRSTRALLQAQALAPAVGTRAAIAALARQFLTGTKVADVFPGTSTWQLVVRVRNDELGAVGGSEAALGAAMMGTGQVPAGFYLTVVSGAPTWAQIDAAVTTWDQSEGSWSRIDSIGVTGI